MAMNPGTRRLLRETASWAVVALIGVAAISHYDALKTGAEQLLGLPTAEDVAALRSADRAPATAPAGQLSAAVIDGTQIEIKAADNGHFQTQAEINGRDVEVMIDTGATIVALSYEDAERAGIYLNDGDFTRSVSTANGIARIAPVKLDSVTVGGITVRDVPAAVAEPGRLRTSLLGMSFLSRLSRFDMRPGVLVLQE
jgi:aspartyl protease family protein